MFLIARRQWIGAADRVLAANPAVASLDRQIAAARIEQMLLAEAVAEAWVSWMNPRSAPTRLSTHF